MPFKATKSAEIWGTTGSWSLAPSHRNAGPSQICQVTLEIEGNNKDGFHLVMAPDGFFVVDNWYASVDEAMNAAESLFGLDRQEWKITR